MADCDYLRRSVRVSPCPQSVEKVCSALKAHRMQPRSTPLAGTCRVARLECGGYHFPMALRNFGVGSR